MWTLSESVTWHESISGPAYQIQLDGAIEEGDDPGIVFMRACDLARDVDRAFNYATGWPLNGKTFRYLIQPQQVPRAWSLDATSKELIAADDWELLDGIASRPRTRVLPATPLDDTLRALEAIGSADTTTAELGQLHYGALTTHDPSLAPLLLSKGLELGRELLPGMDLTAKQAAMPPAVIASLPRALPWFFDISNNRRETRHLVDKRSALALKDELSENERDDFLNGADLILHYLVVSRLNLPLVLMATDGSSRVAS
ncbi:MAG: hypothetical protein WD771_05095 [Gemmatimonadaceae bacterium]